VANCKGATAIRPTRPDCKVTQPRIPELRGQEASDDSSRPSYNHSQLVVLRQ